MPAVLCFPTCMCVCVFIQHILPSVLRLFGALHGYSLLHEVLISGMFLFDKTHQLAYSRQEVVNTVGVSTLSLFVCRTILLRCKPSIFWDEKRSAVVSITSNEAEVFVQLT